MIIERERPDALLPTMGGQTALNVAMALAERRRARAVRRRADRRRRARDRASPRTASSSPRRCERIGLEVPTGGIARTLGRGARRSSTIDGLPGDHPARRSRSAAPAAASPTIARSTRTIVRRGLELSPVQQVLIERSVHRLEGVRARGDARPRRQRGDRLLDREHRSDGRAHRRLDHGRAGDDAHRSRVPDRCATRPWRSSARSASTRAAATSSSR